MKLKKIACGIAIGALLVSMAGCGANINSEINETATEESSLENQTTEDVDKADSDNSKDETKTDDVAISEEVKEEQKENLSENQKAPVDKDTAMKLYSTVLDEIDRDDYFAQHFGFIYLNDDEIPELAISNGHAEHSKVEIYAIINGELKKLYFEDEFGVVDSFGGQGVIEYAEGTGMIEEGSYYGRTYECNALQWDGESDKINHVLSRSITYLDEGASKDYVIMDTKVGAYHYYEFASKCMEGDEFTFDYDNSFSVEGITYDEVWQMAEESRVQNYVNRLKKTIGKDVNDEDILHTIYDFDEDGCREMFAIYDGKLWFVDEDRCFRLNSSSDYSYTQYIGKVTTSGSSFAYVYTDKAVTDWLTDIWMVAEGNPVLHELSGRGCITQKINPYETGEFELVTSAYDSMYSVEDGMYLGHTWKPYFYHLVNGDISKYIARDITMAKADELLGFNLAKKITDAGYTVGKIGMIDNGIVAFNFSQTEDSGDEFNYYILWDQYGGTRGKGSFYGSDESNSEKWQDYIADGVYDWR